LPDPKEIKEDRPKITLKKNSEEINIEDNDD